MKTIKNYYFEMALTDFKVVKRLGKFYSNLGSKCTVNSSKHIIFVESGSKFDLYYFQYKAAGSKS